MAYDRGLEERLFDAFRERSDLVVKKMFGGLCFLLSEHMCSVIIEDKLLARVGPKNYAHYLSKANVTEMDFTGKPIKGMVYILPEGIESDSDLEYWVNICMKFVDSLPPKLPKNKLKKGDGVNN